MKIRLLVVDDELHILRMVVDVLENEGYQVRSATTATDAFKEIRKSAPDLLIADIRLPDMSGFDFCRKLREDAEYKSLPIIFLSTKKQEADKVLGLELGADDYITKPFGSAELVARVKAVLRRRGGGEPGAEETLCSGPLRLSYSRHTVEMEGKRLDLPPKEFELLHLFLRKKGRVMTRQFLMESVWGQEYDSSTRTIDTHIKRLRRDLGSLRDCIETIEGVGYKWEDPAS